MVENLPNGHVSHTATGHEIVGSDRKKHRFGASENFHVCKVSWNQLMVNLWFGAWWFRILVVSLSNNPFHTGIQSESKPPSFLTVCHNSAGPKTHWWLEWNPTLCSQEWALAKCDVRFQWLPSVPWKILWLETSSHCHLHRRISLQSIQIPTASQSLGQCSTYIEHWASISTATSGRKVARFENFLALGVLSWLMYFWISSSFSNGKAAKHPLTSKPPINHWLIGKLFGKHMKKWCGQSKTRQSFRPCRHPWCSYWGDGVFGEFLGSKATKPQFSTLETGCLGKGFWIYRTS